MQLYQQLLTGNDCYQSGRPLRPKGVMVHSTGAANPTLRRYVQPDDGRLGKNSNENDWNRPGLKVCVHGFIGLTKDAQVAAYQTLPWDMRGWHAGTGPNGSANDGYISFEICEDDLTGEEYFQQVYRTAVELTAHLCRAYDLDPRAPGVVISHAEGHQMGIASAHQDVSHWFPRHQKSMDQFRADVGLALEEKEEDMTQEQFDRMMEDYLTRRGQQPASPWAQPTLVRAIDEKITDGTRPRSFATREEVVQLLVNAQQSK